MPYESLNCGYMSRDMAVILNNYLCKLFPAHSSCLYRFGWFSQAEMFIDDFAPGPVQSRGLGAIKCTRHRSAEALPTEAVHCGADLHHAVSTKRLCNGQNKVITWRAGGGVPANDWGKDLRCWLPISSSFYPPVTKEYLQPLLSASSAPG